MKCAFLTIKDVEGWFIYDRLAIPELEKLGWSVDEIAWDDNHPDWNDYHLVIIRSTWNYQDDLESFCRMLDAINDSSAMLANPLEIVQWNINKGYLFELEKNGAEIVPTARGNTFTQADVVRWLDHFGAEEIILKPLIGANADYVFRISAADENGHVAQAIEYYQGQDYLAQPFFSNILHEGEYSLLYFNGVFSHSLLKYAKKGDYRIQEEHGGGITDIEDPPQSLLVAGQTAIDALPFKTLYARVDLVRSDQDTFAVMEVEMIEPCLHFGNGKNATKAFATAVCDYYQANLP